MLGRVPDGARSALIAARSMRMSSPRKKTITAASVPSCRTAVNGAPGSSQPAIAGTMRRWAVDEIGKNSVMPWTNPRIAA